MAVSKPWALQISSQRGGVLGYSELLGRWMSDLKKVVLYFTFLRSFYWDLDFTVGYEEFTSSFKIPLIQGLWDMSVGILYLLLLVFSWPTSNITFALLQCKFALKCKCKKKRFYHIYTLFCLQCVLYWGPAHLPRFFMTSFISVHAHIKILFRILYMHFVLLYMHHPTESFLLIKGLVLNYASKCNSIFLLFLISSMLEFFSGLFHLT